MSVTSRQPFILSPEKVLLLKRLRKKEKGQMSSISKAPRSEGMTDFPLSFGQQRLWFLDQLEPGSSAYLIVNVLRLLGPLDVHVLERSFDEIIRRHESLRTTFINKAGQTVQRIHPPQPFHLSCCDLRSWPEHEREQEMLHLVLEQGQEPFDLVQGPLLRIKLWQSGEQEHILLLAMHHIISDGWSMDVLRHELATLYSAFLADQPSPLSTLPIQYADYALWQRDQLQETTISTQLAYWKEQLADLPPILQLPLDRPRPPMQSFRGANYGFEVPESIARGLKRLSLSEGATPFMTSFAAFAALLARYTGQEDIVVGTPVANRGRAEVDGLIGFFANTLVMRTDLSGNPSFREIVRRVREVALGAYEHQNVPWEQVVEIAQPERDLSYSPLFQMMFVLEDVATKDIELADLTVQPLPNGDETSKFDLSLFLHEEAHTLVGAIEYNTDLFDTATIARLSKHYLVLLEAIVTHPEQSLWHFPLLTAEERSQLLVEWNNPQSVFPSRQSMIHEAFEAQAQARPNAIAVVFAEQHLTYHALNCRANQLASVLRHLGVGPEVRVSVCLERSLDLVVALLGVLKAGGAYVPLDPTLPKERLAFIVEDTHSYILLTQQSLATQLFHATSLFHGSRLLYLDTLDAQTPVEPEDLTTQPMHPTHLAYVIYTSGSTGRPKGVSISHQNLTNLVAWHHQTFNLSPSDRTTQIAGVGFDASVWEIWPSLLAGATLHLPTEAIRIQPEQLRDWLVSEGATISFLPTPLAEQIMTLPWPSSIPLRTILTGGDRLHQAPPPGLPFTLVNNYGPTENTVVTTSGIIAPQITDGSSLSPTIGRPIANTCTYLLDQFMQPVPIGVLGELYIGGTSLARGYLDRPDLTAERFVPNPFSDACGTRLYRTGDLARYRPDGSIDFLGRIDHQVKLRGFRIELGEIESALRSHPQIAEAVVLLREDRNSEKQLVAYVVTEEATMLTSHDLRSQLAEHLPLYMLPSAFVLLETMPITANGKLDRQTLAKLPLPQDVEREQITGPRTPIEEILAGIWGQLLGREQIDITDDFFALGGHSLLIMQVASRVRDSLQVELPLRRFFEQPTIKSLAETIEQTQQENEQVHIPPLLPVSREQLLPLSFAQQRLWFLDQLDPGNVSYTIFDAVRLLGPLHLEALDLSFNEIVRRHEVLRTCFVLVDSEPRQYIQPALYFPLPVQDLSQSELQEEQVQRLIAQEAQRPFDLSQGPLLRARVLRLSPEEHVLLINQHHIVSDGWSAGILNWELSTLYQAYCAGEPSPLPPLTIQYADYAVWQREWLQGARLEQQLTYWKKQLAGVPTALELPTDRPRPVIQTFRGASWDFTLMPQQVEELKRLSREEGATLFMTLLAGFTILLMRLSRQEEILVGTPIANRRLAEIEPLIGFFVNTLVLRSDLRGNPTFREVLRRVREVALGAYSHQDIPFEQVVEAVQPQRDLSRAPLFQVMFSLQASNEQAVVLPKVSIETVTLGNDTTKFDLTLFLEEHPSGMRGTMEYNSDLFDAATISDLVESYLLLLDQAIVNPEQRLGTFSLLTAAQRQLLLVQWNATQTEYPYDQPVHRLFETQAEKTPKALVLRFRDETLTYEILNQRANQLAHALQSLGVGAETRVGLCIDRSIEMVVTVLAILKAGGAYLPLDLSWPTERYTFLLKDAGLNIVITNSCYRQRFPGLDQQGHLICLDEKQQWVEEQPQTNPVFFQHPDQLAYLIYTSGSTGMPKGVMVTHRGLVNYLHWSIQHYQVAGGSGSFVHSSLSFDLTVTSLFSPLLVGGTVTLLPEDQQLEALGEAVQTASQGSLLKITPAHLAVLNAQLADRKPAQSGGVVVIGGEQLYREHLEIWQEQAPETIFVNEYGPTETVVGCCTYQVPAGRAVAGPVPIGRPIANTQLYLLDRWWQPVPRGAVGELYIAGAGLARGYLHQAALTAERFLPNPFSDWPGERMYRTGDLARYQADGTLEFLGRNDMQVKLRGYRIELGEIESLLHQHPLVQDCVVMLREDASGDKRLVAYVVPSQDQEQDFLEHQLRSTLEKHLPHYMVPSTFCYLEALPLTSNGKVDRQALSALSLSNAGLSKVDAALRDDVELRLVHIWEDLLQVRPVKITDDFFQLGGHSLLAVRLMAHIQEVFQQSLPVSILFQRATIEQLASFLRQQNTDHVYSSLVPIQKAQTGHPFFCVHPVGGDVLCYLDLARALGSEQPFYALQASGLYGERDPYQSIEEMAEQYIQALRTQQPEGPYYLGGWSMGGVIAFEMARKLQAQGQDIALLVLLDSYAPSHFANDNAVPQEDATQFIGDLANLLGIEETMPLEHLSPDEQLKHLLEKALQSRLMPEETNLKSLRHRLHVFQANNRALHFYRPQVYSGLLRLIRASDQIEQEQDHTLGWNELVQGDVDIHILPGNHYTLLKQPGVQTLAEYLRRYLS